MDNAEETGNRLLREESVVSFIVAAAKYCALVETESTTEWTEETMRECRTILSEVYASALRFPDVELRAEYAESELPERIVTEDSYRKVMLRLRKFFGEEDRFPEAQHEDQKLSERPVSVSLSELMADLYQALADPLWNIRQNGPRILPETLADLKYAFEIEWGKKLLSVLKQLHNLVNNPFFDPAPALLTAEDEETYPDEDPDAPEA